MKYKQGSHVGVILSFVIFITFAIFIYSILQPQFNIDKSKKTTLEFLKTEILDNISGNLATITLNATGNENCIKYNRSKVNFNITGYRSPNNSLTDKPVYNDSSWVMIKLDTPNSGEISKLYLSDEILNNNIDNSLTSCNEGEILIQKEKKEIFKSKIEKLNRTLTENYEDFKNNLNIPFEDNFKFKFIDSQGNVIEQSKNVLSSGNIFSDESPILYINQKAEIESGTLIIQVW